MIKSTKLRRLKRPWLLVVLACGVGLGWYLNQSPESALRYETAVASRGELTQLVTASGQLNPVVKVEVGSQISGIIQKLLVDFNSSVKEGQVVAQLDPATYEANLIQAQGNLSTVVAALELAQVDLARCTIYAPIDGIVISRNVDVGQTVAASLSAPTLFLIANDLAKMQIEADVGEADIGMVAPGQDVEFTVDAFPGQTFHGKVTQVRNFPKTEQSVVTYVTIIDVSNPDLKLKPGMTANVSVVIARRDNALKIPTSALRFRPPKTSEAKKTDSSSAVTEAKSEKKSAETTRKKDKRKSERTIYVASASGTASAGDQTEGRPQPVQVKTGISDSSNIEVIEGLKEGDRVVIGLAKEEAGSRRTVNPFVFRR